MTEEKTNIMRLGNRKDNRKFAVVGMRTKTRYVGKDCTEITTVDYFVRVTSDHVERTYYKATAEDIGEFTSRNGYTIRLD